jgi:hypothetical protein
MIMIMSSAPRFHELYETILRSLFMVFSLVRIWKTFWRKREFCVLIRSVLTTVSVWYGDVPINATDNQTLKLE